MTTPPRLDGAPGHRWQPRADHSVCIWVARRDIVKKGFRPKTQRIWPPHGNPLALLDDGARLYIKSECIRLQDEMLAWANGGSAKVAFDGTVKTLARAFETDPDSDYQGTRHRTRITYSAHLKQVVKTVGERKLSEIKGRDFKRWFEKWSVDGTRIPRASYRMRMVRMIVKFGATILEDRDCIRLRAILADLEFQQGRRRESIITADQVTKLRESVRMAGHASMALGEALKFDLMVRPKDVIGEWVPVSEPGMSAVTYHGEKWLYGFDWSEVNANFILTHRISKSLRGRRAIVTEAAGKIKSYDLRLAPMVMEELALRADVDQASLTREMFPASGPMIVDERTALPYAETTYRQWWRKFATAVGIPKSVQPRDARAGGATEAEQLGVDEGMIQKGLGHAKPETTRIYTRAEDTITAKVMKIRAEKRPANGMTNKD